MLKRLLRSHNSEPAVLAVAMEWKMYGFAEGRKYSPDSLKNCNFSLLFLMILHQGFVIIC